MTAEKNRDKKKRKLTKRPKQGVKSRRLATKILDLMQASIHSKTALANISEQNLGASNPFRVLISTVLSARTRDPVTEAASARIFSRFPDPDTLAAAKEAQVRSLIKPVAFYRVKARRIIELARVLIEQHRGQVPEAMESLLELPGVGRKTANCVLVYGFKKAAIPVDVHVHRISNRIGLVETKKPEDTELLLSKLYAKEDWLRVNEIFVAFGQSICKPIGPRCEQCAVNPYCKYYWQVIKPKRGM